MNGADVGPAASEGSRPPADPPDDPHLEDAPLPWKKRLGTRLVLLSTACIVLAFGAFAVLGLRVQERHLEDQAIEGAALFSGSIVRSTHDQMLRANKEEAYRVMDEIGRLESIHRVRMFNKEGRVTFSTDREEAGSLVPTDSESCAQCHGGGRPVERLDLPDRARVYRAQHGRVLGLITPIYNEPECAGPSCHASTTSQRVLGIVDVGVSLETVDADLAALRRTILGLGFALALAVTAVVSFLTRRYILKPVRSLVSATREIARGRLDRPVERHEPDEIGKLAESFESMRASLVEARRENEALLMGLERQVEERTRALKSAQAQLVQGEKLASLGKLSASIAHEINNPLAGILTFARLLIRDLDVRPVEASTAEESVARLKLVQRETERCSAIVRNLLDFARQRPPALRDVDLHAALEESLALLDHQVELQGVKIETRLSGRPVVEADFGQLRQAFVNVLLNACEAMPQGGRLVVSSGPTLDGEAFEVTITDTGVGIGEEDLQRVFDPFFTTKERGTGLGLSVVYGILRGLGGDLRVESRRGDGTTVRLRIPSRRREAAPAGSAASEAS